MAWGPCETPAIIDMVGSSWGSFERAYLPYSANLADGGTADLWGRHVVTSTPKHTAHKSRRRGIALSRYEGAPLSSCSSSTAEVSRIL